MPKKPCFCAEQPVGSTFFEDGVMYKQRKCLSCLKVWGRRRAEPETEVGLPSGYAAYEQSHSS